MCLISGIVSTLTAFLQSLGGSKTLTEQDNEYESDEGDYDYDDEDEYASESR